MNESQPRALPFRVMLITDWAIDGLLDKLEAALEAGPGIAVQHRWPQADDLHFYERGLEVARRCARRGVPLFINRRFDVAWAIDRELPKRQEGFGIHLHLPANALSVAAVRPLLPNAWFSVAVHDEAELPRAAGADFALVSPVFPPGSKPTDPRVPLGVDGFWRLARELRCPAFALGGMNATRAASLRAGWDESRGAPKLGGIAVVSEVWRAANPRAATEALLCAG
jgi:thiamine-phosphate pyrophosphorylase